MNTGSAHAGTARSTGRGRRTIHVYYGHDAQPPLSEHSTFHPRLIDSADADVPSRPPPFPHPPLRPPTCATFHESHRTPRVACNVTRTGPAPERGGAARRGGARH
jgi:hypothetical protein